MRPLKCPKQDDLFSYVTLPEGMTFVRRFFFKSHLKSCANCAQRVSNLTQKWESVFSPEVDITSSLVRIYSRLQKDETLILKGWKLGESVGKRQSSPALSSGWIFRGAVAASVIGVFSFVLVNRDADRGKEMGNASNAIQASSNIPFAQIRIEDKDSNRIKVHYVQPELLKSVEFETTSGVGR